MISVQSRAFFISRCDRQRRLLVRPGNWNRSAFVLAWITVLVCGRYVETQAAPEVNADPPMRLRLSWGGGRPHAWSGSIQVRSESLETKQSPPIVLSHLETLSSERDAACGYHLTGDRVSLHGTNARSFDGIDFSVDRWRGTVVVINMVPDSHATASPQIEFSLEELLSTQRTVSIDGDGNRLTIMRAPGDSLAVSIDGDLVRRPGESIRLNVQPFLPASARSGVVELRVRVVSARQGREHSVQQVVLQELKNSTKLGPRVYAAVSLDVTVPKAEGAYDIVLEAFDRGGLPWADIKFMRPIASRAVQLVAVSDVAPAMGLKPSWKMLYELDPASPGLLERLRMIPGASALESIGSIPKMPAFTGLPRGGVFDASINVASNAFEKSAKAARSIENLIPKLSGPLSAGDASLEVHLLGPMLKLPPAKSVSEPSWEAIVIAMAQPGLPHLLEIEYPSDSPAALGVSIVEPGPLGTVGSVRNEGVLRVDSPLAGVPETPSRLVHRVMFWPSTKSPTVVLTNLSVVSSAFIGRVRVSVSTEPLDAGPKNSGNRLVAAYLKDPEFSRFSAIGNIDAGSGRVVSDWVQFLQGANRLVDLVSHQGAGGAMVGVMVDGASMWPSNSILSTLRWDTALLADSGSDPNRKNVLALLLRLFERRALKFVPALEFSAPIIELENLLYTNDSKSADGILCIGSDGREFFTSGDSPVHFYNPLDSRVQDAVERIVSELAGQVASSHAADGVAIAIGYDGWLHMPEVASALDDKTFGRFAADCSLASVGIGPERFAERAKLVEGPLRERWLQWRAKNLAEFSQRLAEKVSAARRDLRFFVTVTDLLSQGSFAERLKPSLSNDSSDDDLLLEAGISPELITMSGRVVLVSPHVTCASDDLLRGSVAESINRAYGVARSLAAARRRGVVGLGVGVTATVEKLSAHSPYGAGTITQPLSLHAVGPTVVRRRWVESMLASDPEVVFDEGILLSGWRESVGTAASLFGSLPNEEFQLLDKADAPLIARSRQASGGVVVLLANASRVPVEAVIKTASAVSQATDCIDGQKIEMITNQTISVALHAWETRGVVLEGTTRVDSIRAVFTQEVKQAVHEELASLRERRAIIEVPPQMALLDNPGFELAAPSGTVPGWEIVESTRGSLAVVGGISAGTQSLEFSSPNGLSTLRSNPFASPSSGRISVAAWLYHDAGQKQPPLRIAVEGVQNGQEYYRFAAVGDGLGATHLEPGWSQFVLQIDDLPREALESLRVRFDMLGPGKIRIDEVRLFDLAFDGSQRVQLSKILALIDHHLGTGDVGTCVVELGGYWPRFLERYVSDEMVAIAAESHSTEGVQKTAETIKKEPPERSGMIDRFRKWWQ